MIDTYNTNHCICHPSLRHPTFSNIYENSGPVELNLLVIGNKVCLNEPWHVISNNVAFLISVYSDKPVQSSYKLSNSA